ncbi:MAG: hypothetical protein HDR05_11980 [Lachnospiraceae bacterium]|nr:hypothetical protein [Lachnospiraceae bacterium]
MPRYQSSAAKAADNRSSAYTLLAVGGIGFVVVVLIFLNVIPLYQNAGISRYLVCGVMGAMFILFIVFGFVSMRDSRLLSVKAKSENSLLSEITRWCEENLDSSAIDAMILDAEESMEELTDEEKYYRRTERMRAMIDDKFMNLDEAFVDDFVDGYYQELYEDNSNHSR